VVSTIIDEQQLSNNSMDADSTTLILQSISKNREDIGNRLEASNLNIEVFKSNMATKKLIDAIYRYTKASYPQIIEASYKTNYKPENKEDLVEDFVCLSTTLGLYGCIVKQEGAKKEETSYYLNTPRLVYGVRRDLTPDNVFKENNTVQYSELKEIMKSSFDFSLDGKMYITDVIFEFDKEMKCYLLYTSQPDLNVKERPGFSLIYTNEHFTKLFINDATQTNDYKKQFYMCYAQSIVRKHENNRFK
jgi:hypothetical protein